MIRKLEELLEQRSPEVYVRYRDITLRAAAGFQKYASLLGELPDCGEQHCQNVIENVDRLVSDDVKEQMPSGEIFVLLCAIQFHGIGLLAEREEGESIGAILADYPERTYDYIHQYYTDWGLSAPEARLIRGVCIGLSNSRFMCLPESEFLHRSRIRVRFLAALLRLGNALDVDYTRVSSYLLRLRKLSPESRRQWLRFGDVQGIDIDSTRWRIVLHVAPETVESRRLLEDFIRQNLQPELDFLREVLDANGLYYRAIEMALVAEIVERDERIVQALEEFYGLRREAKALAKPYKFLDYFDPSDRAIFFGRDADIARFLGYIGAQRLVVLYGESGVGKTSLIRAGLIPNLVQKGLIPVYTRCIEHPRYVIQEGVREVVSLFDHAPAFTERGLRQFLEDPGLMRYEFVIFVDQFEEFFVRFPESARDEFINDLIECISEDASVGATFVLSLRREYFVELGKYKQRLLELYNNAYELRKLTREEVRDAVIRPAHEHGLVYEDTLVDVLIDDIYHEGDYNTPHIQIVCDKLVDSLQPEAREVTLDLYKQLGGASKILAEYLDTAISRLPSEDQPRAVEILKDMVTSHRTKSLNTLDEIARRTGYAREVVDEIVHRLVHEARLVREMARGGSVLFELAHEFLVERVGELLQEEDIRVKAIYEMLDRQMIEWEREGFLLDPDRLRTVNELRDLLSLDEARKSLILESYLNSAPTSADKWFWIRSLGPSGSARVLIKVLDTAGATVYDEAITALAQIGRDALEQLMSALGSANWKVRRGAIEALTRIGSSAMTALVESLGQGDRRVRRGVVDVLSKLGAEALPVLCSAWSSGDEIVKSAVIECTSMMHVPEAAGLLRQFTDQSDSEVRLSGSSQGIPHI